MSVCEPHEIWQVMDGWARKIRDAERGEARDALIAALLQSDDLDELAHELLEDPAGLDAWLTRHKRILGGDAIEALRRAMRARCDRIEAERRAARSGIRVAEPGEAPPPLPQVLGREDLPPMTVPPGYLLRGSGIWRVVETELGATEVRIAHRPILVTGVLRDLDGGAESWHLEWSGAQATEGWGAAIVPASAVQDPRSFVQLRNAGAPVPMRWARDLAAWLDDLAELNSDTLPRAWHTSHLGWCGEGGRLGYLWGRTLIREDGERPCDVAPGRWGRDHVRLAIAEDDGRAQLADGCHAHGTYDGWVRGVTEVLEHPRVLLGVYASLAAAFLGVVEDAPNAIVDWAGETSRGKTTTLMLAASVWGRPSLVGSGVVRTWDVSPAGIEQLASMAGCIPLILDDTKRAQTRGRESADVVATILYQVAAGQGRGRAKPDGMRRTATWRTILLSTGEAPATSFTRDAGARARVLSVLGSPLPDDSGPLIARLRAAIDENYGHAGPRIVAWLLQHRAKWVKLRERYAARVLDWTEEAGGSPVAARLAQTLALIELGARALHDVLGVPRPMRDPMIEALNAAERSAEDADQPAAAAAAVYSWAVQHASEFWGHHVTERSGDPRAPAKGWAGVWRREDNWSEIAFLPDSLRRVLAFLGYRFEDIVPRWFERGWCSRDGKHLGHKRKIDGKADRMIILPRSMLDPTAPHLWGPRGEGDQPLLDEEIA